MATNNGINREFEKRAVRNIVISMGLIVFLLAVIYLIFTYYLRINDPISTDFFVQERTLPPVVTDLDLESLVVEEHFELGVSNEYADWEYTEQQVGVPTSFDQPQAPQQIRAVDTKQGKEVVIFWEAPENITQGKVNIYRTKNQGERGDKVAQVNLSAGQYRDLGLKNNTSYYYILHLITSDGKESANSEQVLGIPTDVVPPQQPSNFEIEDTSEGGELKLTWDNPQDSDFVEVNIYRSATVGDLGKLIISTTEEEYLDQDLKDNKQYYYTLGAVDESGNQSSITLLTTISGNELPFPVTIEPVQVEEEDQEASQEE